MRFPDLVAHRGWARNFPENTLAALRAAIGAGARFVEIDVQLARDGVPVLFHDRTLRRMCAAPGAVHDLSFAELRRLAASEAGRFGDRFAAEPIASLAEFGALVAASPSVHAFVEVKRVAVERFGSELVLERVLAALGAAAERCTLISFSLPFLAVARAGSGLPLGAVVDRWAERERDDVRALRPEYVFCDVDGLPTRAPIDSGGAQVAVWEVDDPRRAVELAERGVDLVETFAIGEMMKGLSELAAGAG